VSDFDIFLDTDNELAFTVAIEGANTADVRSQFVLEGPRGINLCFEGRAAGSEITVDVPSLKGIMQEGRYNSRLEVIVDDRVFTPLQMAANLKPAIKVEAVVRTAQRVGGPVVTAAVVNKAKPIVESPAPVAPAPPAVKPAPLPIAAPKPTLTTPPTSPRASTAPVHVKPSTPTVSSAPAKRPANLDSLLDSLEDL
jgi:hypothetical protein